MKRPYYVDYTLNAKLEEFGALKFSNPPTKDELQIAYAKGMVPMDQLVDGATYYGYCRNSRWATWDAEGKFFRYEGDFEEEIFPPENADQHDLFLAVERAPLTEWQSCYLTEEWITPEGKLIQTGRSLPGTRFGTLQADLSKEEDAMFFGVNDASVELFLEKGCKFKRIVSEEVCENHPSPTLHDLVRDLVELEPALLGREKLLYGKIKQYTHGEKFSVYHRLSLYMKHTLKPYDKEMFRLKMKTHRDLARKTPEELGDEGA